MAGTLRASRYAFAPTAPMPTAPGVCRWCGGRLRALLPDMPADYCEAGCANNDDAPYLGHCGECRREFHTGKRIGTGALCHECDQRERQAFASVGAPGRRTAYGFQRLRRGGFID